MLNHDQLKQTFKDKIIFPGDPTYDSARVVVPGDMDKKPAAIIQVTTEDEVVQVIKLAKDSNVELAIRSGGHSMAGYSTTEGGIVLDLRNMKDLEIDAANRTAWVGTGLTAGEVAVATDKHDLVLGFGDTGSVGVGGITLGGGIGFLVRKFGMTIDSLLAARIVIADGQVLDIDSDNHPDLFWAIKGGGGNFGVVTKFKFQLQPLGQVLGVMMILPATPEVLTSCMEKVEQSPEELSAILNVMPCPPMPFVPAEHHGSLVIMAIVMYAGDPAEGEKIIAPIRALAKPIADMVKPMRYVEMFPAEEGGYHPLATAQNMFTNHVDLELSKKIIEQLQASDAPMRVVQLRVLGGAMARVPVEATAFAHRNSKIMVNIAAFYQTEEEKQTRSDWVKNLCKLLDQGDTGLYVNFVTLQDTARVKDVFPGNTWDKLVEIKRRYDPHNFFNSNYNIQPDR